MTISNIKKTVKRITVTISREIYEKLKYLNDSTFNAVTRAIFTVFFEGKDINYSDYPEEETRIALACIFPDLRRIQSQFDNGKCEKNQVKSTKGVVCPVEPSQIQPNSANSEPSIYNNNIYNNIYNKQTITNNRQGENDKELFTEIETQLNRLKTSPTAERGETRKELISRFNELLYRVSLETKPLTINNEQLEPGQVLERYLQIFETDPEATIKKLARIFHMFDEACEERKITNTYKYCISLFYNQALSKKPVQTKSSDFSTRNYTADEMNSLFDSLDEIEI